MLANGWILPTRPLHSIFITIPIPIFFFCFLPVTSHQPRPDMAEGFLCNIAGDILKKLGNAAVQEIGLCWGFQDELAKLQETVSTIEAVLRDAEKQQQEQSNQLKDWLGKLKDAIYDADDLLDDISIEALRRQGLKGNAITKEVRIFFSGSNQLVYGLKMGRRIKEIRDKLEAISRDRRDFHSVSGDHHHSEASSSTTISRDRDQSHSYVVEQKIIGRENDKIEIIGRLLDSNPEGNVSVVPIVGLGGLGKTAVAQLVYNDVKVESKFDLRMWVSVSDFSEIFDVKLIVEKIIKSATNKDPVELTSVGSVSGTTGIMEKLMIFAFPREARSLDLEQLQVLLRKEIGGKKYLLVLDNVWDLDVGTWDNLKDLLTCGARGSRIIVTTRSMKVANIVRTLPPHELKGLPMHESWSLFLQIVLNGQEPKNQAVVEVGKKIVEKCRGVPLAIRSIGGLLYHKNPDTEWPSFLEEEFSTIGEGENEMMLTLRLSYNHLPSQLKHCFAYCALLPKDKEINVQALIRLWIAEGFIRSSKSNQCLEDVGLQYFKELFWRSFFQEVKDDECGNVYTCRMHTFMHDLARLVGQSEIHVIGSGTEHVDSKTRHLSLHLNSNSFPTHLLKAKRLRTLLLMPEEADVRREESLVVAFCTAYRYLRVLIVPQIGIDMVPSFLGKLKHVRYLDLSNSDDIFFLPNSITKLRNLEVLKLSNCRNLMALPKKTSKLVNLKHLDCEGCAHLLFMPRGLGRSTSLQTLNHFSVDWTGVILEESEILVKLVTCWAGIVGSVSRCDREFLDFFWNYLGNPKYIGGLNELNSLNNLRGELKIFNLGGVQDFVSEFQAANLKEKQHLLSLELIWNGDDVGDSMESAFDYLEPHPNLKKLAVHNYGGGRLPSWLQNLTSLQRLKVQDCLRLASLPQEMKCLKSLQELEISGSPELTRRCKDNQAVDWHIIAHIPNITIDGRDIQRDGQYTVLPRLFQKSAKKKQKARPLFSHKTELSDNISC